MKKLASVAGIVIVTTVVVLFVVGTSCAQKRGAEGKPRFVVTELDTEKFGGDENFCWNASVSKTSHLVRDTETGCEFLLLHPTNLGEGTHLLQLRK